MFIQIFPNQISKITEKAFDMGINTHTSEHTYPGVCANKPTHPGIYTHTYTETTTNTTTNNSLSLKAKKVSNQTKQSALVKIVEKERENEMLKIWNELVEEKNEAEIKLTPKREKLLNLRLKEVFNNDISLWEDLCKKISSSKFLMGEVTNFKAQLDWTLKEENLLKIMENSYSMGDRLVVESKESVEVIEENINDPIWKKTREDLKKQLGEGVFKSWISKLRFQVISDNVAHLTAPTKFIKEWIITNYSEEIKRNFNASGADIQEICITAA